MTYRIYTGPVTSVEIAEQLRRYGFFDVFAGTQHVYFRVFSDHDERDTVEEAQILINSYYPFAGYKVHSC